MAEYQKLLKDSDVDTTNFFNTTIMQIENETGEKISNSTKRLAYATELYNRERFLFVAKEVELLRQNVKELFLSLAFGQIENN